MISTGSKKKSLILVTGLLLYFVNAANSSDVSRYRRFRRGEFVNKFILNKQQSSTVKLMANSTKETTDKPKAVSRSEIISLLRAPFVESMTARKGGAEATASSETGTTTHLLSHSEEEPPIKLKTVSVAEDVSEPTMISVAALQTATDPAYSVETPTHLPEMPPGSALDNYEYCGISKTPRTGRIVGGQKSYHGKWPWHVMVKVMFGEKPEESVYCGGTLISSKYVVTAAHCHPWISWLPMVVVLGTHDRGLTEGYQEHVVTKRVKRVFFHRDYSPLSLDHDLVLVEMDSNVEFRPHIQPICLPHCDEDFSGKMAFVVGWGKVTEEIGRPRFLHEVKIPIVTNEECERMFLTAGMEKNISHLFLCAGYNEGGKDACRGDSGSPLMAQRDDGRWVLVGIVSHGFGCAQPNKPGIYTNVRFQRGWIDPIVFRERISSTSVIEGQVTSACATEPFQDTSMLEESVQTVQPDILSKLLLNF